MTNREINRKNRKYPYIACDRNVLGAGGCMMQMKSRQCTGLLGSMDNEDNSDSVDALRLLGHSLLNVYQNRQFAESVTPEHVTCAGNM